MVMVVMMMMVVMPMAANHDDRATSPMAVVMVMVMPLSHLHIPHISFRGFGRRLLIQRLQRFCRIRDRCEQVSVGIRR